MATSIPTKDTHYYRHDLNGRFLPYRPPRPSYCDSHPDAVAFYEEWVEYKREVKVERSTAWYTWLTFGLLHQTTTKIIITETHWRQDHYCNNGVSKPYVVETVSYVDDQTSGFAFAWDNLIGDDPNRRWGPRTTSDNLIPDTVESDTGESKPFTPPKGEVIDDDYVERLKRRQHEDESHGNLEPPDNGLTYYKEDILVRANLAGEGYVRIIGAAKDRSNPIQLKEGDTIYGLDLPFEFFDNAAGIADRKYIVDYVGTQPAERYGDDVLVLTIKIRETM